MLMSKFPVEKLGMGPLSPGLCSTVKDVSEGGGRKTIQEEDSISLVYNTVSPESVIYNVWVTAVNVS